jgi:hypothetical protein
LFASSVGNKFDSDPKRFRWLSSVTLVGAGLLEMTAPLYPEQFLLIAATGTVGKNISCIAASASRAAFHLNFSNHNNIADITAKNATQTTGCSVVGMGLGIFIGSISSATYPTFVAAYLALSAGHLF